MLAQSVQILAFGLLAIGGANAMTTENNFLVHPFQIDLSKDVPRMLELINHTRLPNESEYPGVGSSFGTGLDFLKGLQKEWLTVFDWKKEQASMNQLKHFKTSIEDLTIHFVHEKSANPNAIPLILNHGWPGSFLEFVPITNPLTQRAKASNGTDVSFDIIIPSLPGFGFSSRPPANWTYEDTARVFNTLTTDVLGYKTFAVYGTDLGAPVAYTLYDQYNKTTRAAHFSFLPFVPLVPDELAALNITLSPLEQFEAQRTVEYNNHSAYLSEQLTEPNTIGLALYDNPVGQLSWIGVKIQQWSDPRSGSAPSVLNNNKILRTVSLYYLTKTFISSVYAYTENAIGFKYDYTMAHTDAPMLVSIFKYNSVFWPRVLAEKVGNLVLYRNNNFGGHFPELDNPPALIADIREIGAYWQ